MRLAPLLLVLCSCYPYLPGSFDDYAVETDVDTSDFDTSDVDTFDVDTEDPDTEEPDTDAPVGEGPVVIGWANWGAYIGDYWGGGIQNGDFANVNIVFGLSDPLTNWDYASSRPSGCVATENGPGTTLVQEVMDLGGPSTVTVDMGVNRQVGAGRASGTPVWTFQQDDFGLAQNVAGALDIDLGASGRIDGVAFRTPSDFTIDSPFMSGASIPTVSRSSFSVGWSGTLSDDMTVQLQLFDVNNTLLGDYVCSAASVNGAGSVTFRSSLASEMSQAALGVVVVARIRDYRGSVSGSADASSRMSSAFSKIGLVRF